MLDGASPVSIGFLFTAVAVIIGVVTFFAGRKSSVQGEGEWRGELKATLKHMQEDISEIKAMQAKQEKQSADTHKSMESRWDTSIQRLEKRLDKHMLQEHNKKGDD